MSIKRTSKKEFQSGKLIANSVETNATVYNYIPPESPNGSRLIFSIVDGFKPGSARVRINGLGAIVGIEYIEINGLQIRMSYAMDSTETIRIDYEKK